MGVMLSLLLGKDEVVQSDIVSGLLNVLSMILMIADAALVAFAVYMFFMMMTASDEGKRRNVKKHFFNTLSSIFIILALIGTLSVIKVNITLVEKPTGGGGAVGTLDGTVKDPVMQVRKQTETGPGIWAIAGTFTISYKDFQFKEAGIEVERIENFTITSSAGGFPQACFTTGSPGKTVTITYKNTAKLGDDGCFFLPATKTFHSDSGAGGTVTFMVSVSGTNSKKGQVAGTVSGTLSIVGADNNIRFG